MIARALITFAIMFLAFYVSINGWRRMTGKDQWMLAKSVTYSIICSVLAFVVLVSFVILF